MFGSRHEVVVPVFSRKQTPLEIAYGKNEDPVRNVVPERYWERSAVQLIELQGAEDLRHGPASARNAVVNTSRMADLVCRLDETCCDELTGRAEIDAESSGLDQPPAGIRFE